MDNETLTGFVLDAINTAREAGYARGRYVWDVYGDRAALETELNERHDAADRAVVAVGRAIYEAMGGE